jgi:hypothetical protein
MLENPVQKIDMHLDRQIDFEEEQKKQLDIFAGRLLNRYL